MFILALFHIAGCFCFLWTGFLFYKFIFPASEKRSVVYYAITGLVILTAITQLTVLFIPVTDLFRFSIPSILLLLAIIFRKQFSGLLHLIRNEWIGMPRIAKLSFIVMWLMILLFNAGPVIMDDTESYHIQSIKWIKEYGTVPGLANLHERYGFNSSWFSSVALFSFYNDAGGGYTVLNGLLSVWLCFWMIAGIANNKHATGKSVSVSFFMILACCLVIWPLLRGNAASANYDFITTVIVLILFCELFLSEKNQLQPRVEWIIWPIFLFTVRIINFPLLLLTLFSFFLLLKNKQYRNLLIYSMMSLLIVIPFLARNVMISGYPFYPAMQFDWFAVDWKADPLMTENLLDYIKYYNRVSTGYMDIEQTKALGSGWIPVWFSHLFWYDKFLLLAGITGIFGALIISIKNKFTGRPAGFLFLIFTFWLVLWLLTSPDPRFIYGLLLFGVFLFSFFFNESINRFLTGRLLSFLFVILITGTAGYIVTKIARQPEYRNWMMAAKLPVPPVKEIIIDGITLNIPERVNDNWNPRCYATPLPCVYKIDPRLEARGQHIKNGFRLQK